jgi:hypothetical protein
VQSLFTVYGPVTVLLEIVPFALAVKGLMLFPFPSKVMVPTAVTGPTPTIVPPPITM